MNLQVNEAPAIGNEVAKALQEALASGQPTVPLELAARAVGIKSRSTAYRAARAGKLPFRTLLVGGQGRRVVPTAELKAVLGLDPAPDAAQAGG
ncbi:MAG TPA: DNA-binding protein [Actinomycetes bacterium]|nr:DNA-binding protein [Actinomycetes bacterium]